MLNLASRSVNARMYSSLQPVKLPTVPSGCALCSQAYTVLEVHKTEKVVPSFTWTMPQPVFYLTQQRGQLLLTITPALMLVDNVPFR